MNWISEATVTSHSGCGLALQGKMIYWKNAIVLLKRAVYPKTDFIYEQMHYHVQKFNTMRCGGSAIKNRLLFDGVHWRQPV